MHVNIENMIFIAIHNDLQRSSSLKNTVLIAIYKDLQTLTSKKSILVVIYKVLHISI